MGMGGRLRAAAVVSALLGAALVGAAAPAAAAEVELRDLSWSDPRVDATTGTATNTVTFTATAMSEFRTFHIGLEDGAGGVFQPRFLISFGPHASGGHTASRVSTDGAWATYRYTFHVPEHAATEEAVWRVTSVADAELPQGLGYSFTARSLVDSTGPELVSVTPIRDAALSRAVELGAPYRVAFADAGAGFKQARVTVTGPDGQTSTATSQLHTSADYRVPSPALVSPRIPAGSLGTWRVTEVELTDLYDNRTLHTGLSLGPITFTDNAHIQATGFAVAPNPVDTWHRDQQVAFTATVTSPFPITRAVATAGAPCTGGESTVPVGSGGVVSVPITVPVGAERCPVTGLAVHDEAGHLSVYGSAHLAPGSFPAVTRMTGPGPELLAVAADRTSVPWHQPTRVEVTLDVRSWSPGVTRAAVTAGGGSTWASGVVDAPRVRDGRIVVPLTVTPQGPGGRLGLSVELHDAAGMRTWFTPSQVPMPELIVEHPPGATWFTPVTPTRLRDTRAGDGPLGPGGVLALHTWAPEDATAVVLNVTAVDPTASSFLTVWPAGRPRPTSSNLNSTTGRTVSNLVTVPLDPTGHVQFYNHAGSTHLVVDVFGYYREGVGSPFGDWPQTRAMDTRLAGGPLPHGTERLVDLGDLARTAPTAVVLNVTATGTTAPGYLTVWADGAPRPATSNINFPAGWTGSNQVIVPVDPQGSRQVRVYNHGGPAHVVVDVVGLFGSGTRGLFVPAGPRRVLDTRPASAVGPAGVRELPVPGLPPNAFAVVLNVTATEPTAASFLTAWPFGSNRPGTSSLNFGRGETVPNMVTVPVVDGKALLYNQNGSTHVVADLFGYYVR